MQKTVTAGKRIESIDLARGVALVAMAIYHFTWDLEFFGYVEPGLTEHGGWKLFARCIASSFLFLVGVSLFLAHHKGVRWRGFGTRLAMVAGAAAAITVVTWFAVPNGFIFFGILHEIALASVLGLAFLWIPWPATALVAAAIIAAPNFLRGGFFDHSALWWVGLSSVNPRSNDYVPVFPWFGAVLLGLAAARLAHSAGAFEKMRGWDLGGWSNPLRFAGRHSLAFYLIHQPVLIACVWAFSQVSPPSPAIREPAFISACERQCAETREERFCKRYCGCMLETIKHENLVDKVFSSDRSDATQAQLEDFAATCTIQTDDALPQGGTE